MKKKMISMTLLLLLFNQNLMASFIQNTGKDVIEFIQRSMVLNPLLGEEVIPGENFQEDYDCLIKMKPIFRGLNMKISRISEDEERLLIEVTMHERDELPMIQYSDRDGVVTNEFRTGPAHIKGNDYVLSLTRYEDLASFDLKLQDHQGLEAECSFRE